MARAPLRGVRWVSISELAEIWHTELGQPKSLVLRELKLFVLNRPRLAAGEGLIPELPPESQLPNSETTVSADDVIQFATKQQWTLPRSWPHREQPSRGRGRPERHPTLLAELQRRAQVGELAETLCAEARYLRSHLQQVSPTVEPLTEGSILNKIRRDYHRLRQA